MKEFVFPTNQRELLIAARGTESQAAFARTLGVDRSCLCRYESEKLGAPTTVLNYCLSKVAEQVRSGSGSALHEALQLLRQAASAVEYAALEEQSASKKSMKRARRAG
ncbi:transcriptional regulator [Pseudoxanthomonas winnipegensis]|uniref:Transcriptional regulator n=1 Tax=Pseudoxanthomonas winnipegensis TaxID=2480810 RepID=A0ABY1WAD0_9GAMM|nr:transcriptional regulator [Pseudoxanthomonas winnipegensis]TAA07447.1 transcriptional regulator [Pseudoxanthomonas winnipegensis]TAA17475.1 transcriptional regulator [Pseudoxanthomonas winnipegensis]TAH71194.1 transcriptional regulator [Pseudoxanthomonas winnipegensis]